MFDLEILQHLHRLLNDVAKTETVHLQEMAEGKGVGEGFS